MKKMLAYRERGFTQLEISQVMGVHLRTVGDLLRVARQLGLQQGVPHVA